MVSKLLVARRAITRFVAATLSWLAYAKVVRSTGMTNIPFLTVL